MCFPWSSAAQLRDEAIEQIYRLRRFSLHVVAFALTGYVEEHTWPSRFASDTDAFGTYLGPPVRPVGRYIRRPVTQAEVDREVERLRARRAQRGG